MNYAKIVDVFKRGFGRTFGRQLDNHEMYSEEAIEKAHTGIVWKIITLTPEIFATCSNDKYVKVW